MLRLRLVRSPSHSFYLFVAILAIFFREAACTEEHLPFDRVTLDLINLLHCWKRIQIISLVPNDRIIRLSIEQFVKGSPKGRICSIFFLCTFCIVCANNRTCMHVPTM
ncbi:hypothetical protein PAHAL_5G330100 [Panicum hallii]|uniref:Secreted protein n=1 Tax=Panicum hallii TaxID=206008 RepID=A0A2S3HVJ9_9POAL|nr:hypothetical protein PAHAL_5G330100 [Panicum hallii]